MLSLKETTEYFSRIWQMKFTAATQEFCQELERLENTGTFQGEYFQRREEREDMAEIHSSLGKLLEGAYVTDPCKQFLANVAEVTLCFGIPPNAYVSLDHLGIESEKERYGIFDPYTNLESVERRLLKLQEDTVPRDPLIRIWREAYRERYQR